MWELDIDGTIHRVYWIVGLLKFLFRIQGTPVNITVGSHVWAEEPDVAWIDGVVSKINGAEVEVDATNGKKVLIWTSTKNESTLYQESSVIMLLYDPKKKEKMYLKYEMLM